MKILVEKYAFDVSKFPPVYVPHEFAEHDRSLVHTIDGEMRATVPALGVGEYLKASAVSQALTDQEKKTVLGAFSDFAE